MRQPLRRLPSVTAVMACVATLAFICCALFLPSAQAHSNSESEEVSLRREEQEILACQLRSNESLSGEFFSSASTNPDGASDFRTLIATIGHDSQLRCLSTRTCPGAPVTWCVHMYHPVETISLCYNGSGHVINITAAADRLRLQDKYQIQPEECSTNWPGCITLKSAEYFMTFSYMTCTAANQTCYHQTDYKLQVIASGERAEIPKIALDNNTNLYLNETNIFVCTSSLPADPFPVHYETWWEVDNVRISNIIHHNPYCGTDVSLYEAECGDADDTSGVSRERVRVHQLYYSEDNCPRPNVLIRAWLVIENATAEDAKKSYECHSEHTAVNPTFHTVPHHEVFNIQPVYPLVDVVPIERPTSSPNLSYPPNSDETIEWSCSVQAGVQDRLIWTHDGAEILDVDLETVHNLTNVAGGVYNSRLVENVNCSSLQSIGDRVVVSKPKTIGDFHRQFTATLFVCGIHEKMFGRYECLLRRGRKDGKDVPIWSGTLSRSTEDPDTQLTIITSVSVITIFVVIIFTVTIITVFVIIRTRVRSQKHSEKQKSFFRHILPLQDGASVVCSNGKDVHIVPCQLEQKNDRYIMY